MSMNFNKSEFASVCHTTVSVIIDAIQKGKLVFDNNGIDYENPINRHFALSRQKEFKKRKKIIDKVDYNEDIDIDDFLFNENPMVKEVASALSDLNNTLDDINGNGEYTHADAKLEHTQAQTAKIHAELARRMNVLILREKVDRAFAQFYSVVVNQFLTLGDRLSPIIAGHCGKVDPETIQWIKDKIDKDITKSIKAIKEITDQELTND